MKRKFTIKFIILFFLISNVLPLKCGENEIDNCLQCGEGENSSKCSLCEDKYFLVLGGEKCISCNDEYLGQIGCDGNCHLMKSERNIFCDKCKEEYYYEMSEGICASCSYFFENCLKCSYSSENGENNEKVFKCLECDESFYLNEAQDKCVICDYNCKKCLNENICDICLDGYVKHPKTEICESIKSNCLEAEYSNEENPVQICKKCKEGYFLDSSSNNCCECDYDYAEKYGINLRGCQKCSLNNGNNELICEKAFEYHRYGDKNIYSYCHDKIENCNKCSFHSEEDFNNNNLICDECEEGKFFSLIENKCKDCSVGNNGCIICSDEIHDNSKCDKCQKGFYLNSDSSCIKCSDNLGEGCSACSISPYDLSLYCSECEEGYTLDIDGKCKHCVNDLNLIGCKKCVIAGNNKPICAKCYSNYQIYNYVCVEKNSEFLTCRYLTNIGTSEYVILSCIECISYDFIFILKENGAKICVNPSDYPELKNCKEGMMKNINNGEISYTCLSCSDSNLEFVYDNNLKKEVCQCKEGYYEDLSDDFICKICDDKIYNCKKCHKENEDVICDECLKGFIIKNSECESISDYYCEEFSQDGDLYYSECIKYKEPYFKNKISSDIEYCFDYIDFCSKCSYINSESSELKCEKCLDNYFLNKNGICQHCYINENESPYCISCTDDENLKNTNSCQNCTNNYFLTRENKCIFCKSEKYGGKDCKKCGYINIAGIEKIGCIECENIIAGLVLAKDGTCFNSDENEKNCQELGYYFENNKIKYGCIECEYQYYLNEVHKCTPNDIENCRTINLINNQKECTICSDGYKLVDNQCVPVTESDFEGCSSSYHVLNDILYCYRCKSSYMRLNSGCYKFPNHPLLEDCTSFYYEKGLYMCDSCKQSSYSHYVNSILFCGFKYFGYCSKLINIWTEINPKYSCEKCSSFKIPVIDENGIVKCIDNNIFENRCLEGKVNTYYYNDIYTCTKCNPLYILSYSDYYEKNICKSIYEDEKIQNENNNIDLDNEVITGCKNKILKPKSENQIQCGECEGNYFQILPGQCELCGNILSNCQTCEYIENNEIPSFIPVRKRNLICTKCIEGYTLEDNICIYSKIEVQIPGCKIVENEKCSKAESGYYISEEGNVEKCEENCAECSLKNIQGTKIVECSIVEDGYFINKEGLIKQCNDEIEGISNCNLCVTNYNYKLTCKSCIVGYILDNGKCIEIYNIEGCSLYMEFQEYNSYICGLCKDDYILLENNYTCILKTEEIKDCSEGEYLNDKNDITCTQCSSSLYKRIKNLNNIYRCYYRYLDNTIKYCKLILNIGTYDNPIFECSICDYPYVLISDDYGNKKCVYYNSKLDPNCEKGIVTQYTKKSYNNDNQFIDYVYKCTECKTNYKETFDEITNDLTCSPIECTISFCEECEENNVYSCKKCSEGYINKNGLCNKKPKIIPTITFKDIFRLSLNKKFNLNGNMVLGLYFTLKGITNDNISDKHSFAISSIFSKKNTLRNLENSLTFKTQCQYSSHIDSQDSDLKFVDYDCFANTGSTSLSNYKLNSINDNEYQDKDNLNALNLNNLVEKTNNVEKEESSFNQNEINKYIIFNIDDKSKNIKSNITDNNFIIYGKTNKVMSNNLSGKLSLSDTNQKSFDCEIDAKDKDKASMICDVNITDLALKFQRDKFKFEEVEITGENNNIYFEGIKDIQIFSNKISINPDNINDNNNDNDNNDNSDSEDKNKKILLIVIICVGIVLVIAIIGISIYCYKKKKNKNINEVHIKEEKKESRNAKNNIVLNTENNDIIINKPKRTKKKKKSKKKNGKKKKLNIGKNEE